MYYHKLNFPCPPTPLLEKCVEQVNNNIGRISYVHYDEKFIDFSTRLDSPWQVANNEENNKQATYVKWEIPVDVETWCKNNLPINDADKIILQSFEDGETIIPHVDVQSFMSINLLLTDNDSITCWYEPKEEYKNLNFPPVGEAGLFIKSRLVKVAEVKLQKHNWYMIKTRKVHSVENLANKKRIAIRIVFYSDFFDKYLKY